MHDFVEEHINSPNYIISAIDLEFDFKRIQNKVAKP
jgi:hypothetical protein